MLTALQEYVDQQVDRTDCGHRTVTAAKDGTVKDTNYGKLEHNHIACTRTRGLLK